jgi:Uma2 family endonuclease
MRSAHDAPLMTAEEVSYVSIPGRSIELVRGRLVVMEQPGTEHGRVQANLMIALGVFVRDHKLGAVFGQDTGFKIAANPDSVRGPDVAFVATEHIQNIPKRGYAAFAPDLVVEIISPNDGAGEILAKVADWLEAGTRLVWVIDVERAEARVYRSDGSLGLLAADGSLDGEDVVPGFRVALADVLRLA